MCLFIMGMYFELVAKFIGTEFATNCRSRKTIFYPYICSTEDKFKVSDKPPLPATHFICYEINTPIQTGMFLLSSVSYD